MSPTVTVIGAGIIGLCCASYLQRHGRQVRLVDSLPPGRGTSFGNAGGLSSGACVPIAMPGIVKQIPKWLFDPEGPLVVRPGYLLKALPWLLQFIGSAKPEIVERSADALLGLTRPLFENLVPIARDAGVEDLIRRVGQLHLYSTDAAFAGDARGREMRTRRGVKLEILGAEAIRQMEPDLAPIFRHAVYFPDHGHCANPLGLSEGLAAEIVRRGGEIVQAQVRELEIGPDGVRSITTESGSLAVEELVIAAGAWSHRLAAKLGHKVPLESQRGYHAMLASPSLGPRRNVQWTERKFIATPMQEGVRFAGTVEIAGLEAAADYRRADVLLKQGLDMFPGLTGGEVTRWMGHRPCIPDSVPVIGRSPIHRNVTFAFGHGHIGLICAPTTGRLVAELVTGTKPSLDPRPYRVDRF
ncbi:MAG: FAD-dependent oxidoreductase [Alphaproteobacteria bacterium]|nr:FAD-dependent oxidoreductase [Alphaproteobacteria bacterium]